MNYQVKSIDYQDCKEWFLKKHYAKRIPPIEFCFGLYNEDILVGVCSYGTPVSSVLRELFPSYKLYELNRLVVSEGLPKNSLSYFVAKTIIFIPKPSVLVSYADTSQNHNGYIYQATNWIYAGDTAKGKEYWHKGKRLHSRQVSEKGWNIQQGQKRKTVKPSECDIVETKGKHRYLMPLDKETRDKIASLSKPYPKRTKEQELESPSNLGGATPTCALHSKSST